MFSLCLSLFSNKVSFSCCNPLTLINYILNPFIQSVCVAVAALMQYVFMAALCWMLVEGIYLYLFIVKVYNINHQIQVYHGMFWGKDSYTRHPNITIS